MIKTEQNLLNVEILDFFDTTITVIIKNTLNRVDLTSDLLTCQNKTSYRFPVCGNTNVCFAVETEGVDQDG